MKLLITSKVCCKAAASFLRRKLKISRFDVIKSKAPGLPKKFARKPVRLDFFDFEKRLKI
jgi:hypothetical protein